MTDFLPGLGALTLSGSLIIGLLALTSRSAQAQFGARWRCWIWLLLCLRLAVPFSIPSLDQANRNQPLIQLPAPSDTVIYQYRPTPTPQPPASSAQTPPPSQSAPVPPATKPPAQPAAKPAPGFELSLSQILTLAWLAGALAFLLWTLISHLRFLTYLRRWSRAADDARIVALYNQLGDRLGLDRRPRLMVCPGLRAPMLAGLFRPILLLPQEVPDEQVLGYSLLHELTHFRRRDIWLKTLALWVNALHWFNPLAWYMVRLVERDTELACDEGALRQLPQEEHAAYGRTILAAAERRSQ